MNAIELSKEQYMRLQIKNDVRKWLRDTKFNNLSTDDFELVEEMVCHYLSGRNTVLQFQNMNRFCLQNLSYLAMIYICKYYTCDFKFVTFGKSSKKYNGFLSLMRNNKVQCNAEFISYDEFIENPVIDKYTIIDYHADEEFIHILSKISWNYGLLILR